LKYHDEMHGFQYLPMDSSLGTVITTTDEDWVRSGVSTRLMANIIYHLIYPPQPTINEAPIDLGIDTFICSLDTIVLSLQPKSSIGFWQDGSISNSFLATTPGLYWATIENACENRYGEINIQGLSDLGLPIQIIDTTFCTGAEIFVDISVINGRYKWMDGSGEPSRWLSNEGKYLVEVGNGCFIDTLQLNLYQEDCTCAYIVPNVFSPNNDGINDSLHPTSPCIPLNFSFSIFDRWGTMVFYSKDPLLGWRGIFNGNELPAGVYVYHLSYSFTHDKMQEKIGDITLLK